MKVICQKCSATYAINDAAIPAKGARAQCPRCKHLQAVKREEAPAAAPPAPPPADDPFAALGAAPPPPPPMARAAAAPLPQAPAAGDPFADFEMPTAASPGPIAPPPRAPAPAVNGPAAPKRPASDPFAHIDVAPAPPPGPAGDPFADLDFGGGAPPPPAAPAPVAAEPAGPAVLGKCSVCGKPLTDPFDAALGSCEACRAKETPLSAPGAVAPPLAKPRAAAAVGAVTAAPPPAADARGSNTTGSRPLMVDLPRRASPAPAPATSVPARAGRRSRALPLVAAVVGLLAVVGGLAVWKLRPVETKPAALVVPPALAAKIRGWTLAFPDRTGTAREHLEAAHQRMLIDRPGEYRSAEVEFERAAVLAGENGADLARATAGVVEAYLFGRGESRDPEMEAALVPLLDSAAQLAPNLDAVLRARAYALAHQSPGQLDEARHLAQQALEAAPPEGKAEALLALGTLSIDSAQQSLDFVNRAIQANPKLERAYYLRGLAAARTGHFKQALADFEDRVKRDPGAREAAMEVAKVHLATGDPVGARAELQHLREKDPRAAEALLTLGIIDYQLDHNLRAAEAQLAPLLNALPPQGPLSPLQVRMLVHGAAIAREAGELTTARKRVDRALAASPDAPAALDQSVLVALAQKQPAAAHPAIDKLLNASPEGVRVEALAARVAFAEGKPSEGVAHERAALRSSSIDLRAALLGAVLAAKAGRGSEAYELMKSATEIDPAIELRHRGITEFYESARSELAQTAGGFEDDTSSGLPIAYAGVVQYHRGDLARAERSFGAALKIEPDNAVALSHLAQLQLEGDRGNPRKARELADRALAGDRSSVLAMYIEGRAREALKDLEGARQQYRDVLRQAPGFTSATYRLAVLERAEGRAASAEELLGKILFADPDDTAARRELFELGF